MSIQQAFELLIDKRLVSMNIAVNKFAIGQPVLRTEDPVLLRGEGAYSDDVKVPGQLYSTVVRSRHPHGILRGIDSAEARSMPGVRMIVSAADLTGCNDLPGNATLKNRDGSSTPCPPHPALAHERVRYVGEPVAIVIAETRSQADDAAEAVMLDIDPLPAVVDDVAALAPNAPRVHDGIPGNLAADYHYGDPAAVAAALDAASHICRLPLRSNRVVVCAMEPRSATGEYDPETGRWTLHVGSQGVWGMRNGIAHILGVKPERVRVVTGHVGGSFGMKAAVYPEYIALLHAAKVLGRPVHWADDRSGSFVSDTHGRDHSMSAELGLDAEGRILALRVTGTANMGAYLGAFNTFMPTANLVKNVIGAYRTPLLEVSTQCVYTNTTPVGPYRGAGRPEGNYYIERLMDNAAAELGIDPMELRRRNHILPHEMPFEAASGLSYDSGDFPTVLDKALVLADWGGFDLRRIESSRRGKLRGRGVGQYLEVTAGSGHEMGGIRFEPDGMVTILTGTLDYGQGHAAPFAQVLADQLGIPFERIRLVQGDSDELIVGGGTGGSRSMMASGSAIVAASGMVIDRGRGIAAHVLEAAVSDIEFSAGRFTIVGTDRGIGIMELAAKLHDGLDLPPGMEPTLDVQHDHVTPPSAFPNGCHVAEVEIDPETGVVGVARYVMVNDFGVLINPMLVAGQAHGGVAQGIGQALMEQVVYDEDGQILTGSFMDYALPHADGLPEFVFSSHPVPARTNGLGVKGCGEAGCAGALPAVMNAVVDALRPLGIKHIDMPATPERVWKAIATASN